MFYIKKIISSFITPPGIFVLILFTVSFYFLYRKKRRIFSVMFISAFVFYVITIPLVSNYLGCMWEKDFINPDINGDVIVYLGAGVIKVSDDKYVLTESALERLFAVYRVYNRKKVPVILSAGSVFNMVSESETAKKILVELGVNEQDIYTEEYSKDTYENAFYAKKICDKYSFKKPVLVTDAYHLKRAVYIFKKAGFEHVGYYPSSYICNRYINLYIFLPSDFKKLRYLFHEIFGYVYYRVMVYYHG